MLNRTIYKGVKSACEVEKHAFFLEERLPPTQKTAIYDYYLPVFYWIKDNFATLKQSNRPPPCMVVGISCAQGGGKTTLVAILRQLFALERINCTGLSLDDVYWPFDKQQQIAKEFSGNSLLQFRGNPGTHDLDLLFKVIQDAKRACGTVSIPRYCKSANNGRGDRVAEDEWERISAPLDVLLIEGWCLGFKPVLSEQLIRTDLSPINKALMDMLPLEKYLDSMLIVKVGNIDWIYRWREEAEQKLRTAGKPALSSKEVVDFVDRFIPAYRQYLNELYEGNYPDGASRLVVEIDENRSPLGITR